VKHAILRSAFLLVSCDNNYSVEVNSTSFTHFLINQLWANLNLCFAGEAYEYATFLSVEKKDIAEFERNICVLKSYYDEFEGVIPTSQKKNAILGLYLLYLLSYNK